MLPEFLQTLPQWHQSYFPNWQEHPALDPTTSEERILLAMADVCRIMDIASICLIIFPFPGSEEQRESFKNSITDAVRFNGLKLVNARVNIDSYDVPWHQWADIEISLDELDNAASRGWLHSDGLYVPIWRRYIFELEKPFMKLYQQELESMGLTAKTDTQEPVPQDTSTPKPNHYTSTNSKYAELFKDAYHAYWAKFGKQPNAQTLWTNLPELCPEYQVTIPPDSEVEGEVLSIYGVGYVTWANYKRQFSNHFPALK